MNKALCPGTFDPVTNGHLDVIMRVAKHFDQVVVAVAANAGKNPLFTLDERVEMLEECLSGIENVEVVSFDCLLVELAHRLETCAIVKGLRAMSDFEFEFQMAQFNRQMDENIETFFVMASPEYTFLSSSGIKEVIYYGGCVRDLVPESVVARLVEKFGKGMPPVAFGKE